MLKFALLLALALPALLAACGGGDPPPPTATPKPPVIAHPIEFVMDAFGEDIEIKIRNNGDQSYLYSAIYPACDDLKFYDDSKAQHHIAGELYESRPLPPSLFIIPQGTHCDLPGGPEIRPGEEVVLLTWYQRECIKDNWGCVQSIQVNPGRYRIIGEFSPVGGDARTVAEQSFVIADPPPTCQDTTLEISVKGDALQFDLERLEVAAGIDVVLCFTNVSGFSQHNWVLAPNGTGNYVAQRGIAAGPDNDYVQPDDSAVIVHTRLVDPRETVELRFTISDPGNYQFICTFPGHNFTMFGDFVVTG